MATDCTTGSLHVPSGVSCMTHIGKRPSVTILLSYSGFWMNKMEENKRTWSLCFYLHLIFLKRKRGAGSQ